eukprot:COSAG02_NODE_984_length_15467_cov_20.165799_2_plen_203_part_00
MAGQKHSLHEERADAAEHHPRHRRRNAPVSLRHEDVHPALLVLSLLNDLLHLGFGHRLICPWPPRWRCGLPTISSAACREPPHHRRPEPQPMVAAPLYTAAGVRPHHTACCKQHRLRHPAPSANTHAPTVREQRSAVRSGTVGSSPSSGKTPPAVREHARRRAAVGPPPAACASGPPSSFLSQQLPSPQCPDCSIRVPWPHA